MWELGFIQEKDGHALESKYQRQFGGCQTVYRAEKILDTDLLLLGRHMAGKRLPWIPVVIVACKPSSPGQD